MSVSYTKIGTRKQNGKHRTAGLAHTRGETGSEQEQAPLGSTPRTPPRSTVAPGSWGAVSETVSGDSLTLQLPGVVRPVETNRTLTEKS